ncbi:MAG: leucine-rich repeat protein [Treponema sp.]|nr:leucine-rich repeat protein [Treponema sp.]
MKSHFPRFGLLFLNFAASLFILGLASCADVSGKVSSSLYLSVDGRSILSELNSDGFDTEQILNIKLKVALQGSVSDSKTVDFPLSELKSGEVSEKSLVFSELPIDSFVSVTGLVYATVAAGESDFSLIGYFGSSEQKKISSGSNSLTLNLSKVWNFEDAIWKTSGLSKDSSEAFLLLAFRNGTYCIFRGDSSSLSDQSLLGVSIVSMGNYKILSKNEKGEPAKTTIREMVYLPSSGDYEIIHNPEEKTFDVTDGCFSFTGEGDLSVEFGKKSEEPEVEVPEPEEPEPEEPEPEEPDPDTPEKSLTALTLTSNATEAIVGGDPVVCTVTATYSDSTEEEIAADKLEWTSSDEAIATVDNGVVTALAAGEVTITASMDEKSASVTLTFKVSTSGTITTEIPSLLTLSISDQTTLYLNAGSVTFLAKTQDGNDVGSESITWDAKLFYKGREIENPASAPYYAIEQGIFEIKTPLPVSGSYQLFVTAKYNGLTSSATFDIEVEDYLYTELDFTGIVSGDISTALTNALSDLTTGSSTVYFKLSGQTSAYYTNLFSSIKSAIANASSLFFIDASELTTTNSTKNIAECAMQSCSKIQGLILPNDMDVIGYYAFADCSNLETVVFGKGLKSMSTSFNSCAKLSSVTFPEGSSFESFGMNSFTNCSALKTFKLPASIKGISADAFYGSAIEEFTLEDTSGTWYYTFNSTTYGNLINGTLEPESVADGSCGLVADLQTVTPNYLNQETYTFPDGASLTQKLTWLAKQTSNTDAEFSKSIYLFHKSE